MKPRFLHDVLDTTGVRLITESKRFLSPVSPGLGVEKGPHASLP